MVTRRTLTRGAAWSVPVIAAASVVPAYAASTCNPSLRFSGGLTYDWGNAATSTTDQQLTGGGQTYVDGLPAGVTVTSVDYKWWIQNRDGQDTGGPGIFWLGNKTSDKTCSSTGCSLTWTPTAGSGWVPTVTNTSNFVSITYPEGQRWPSWDLNFSWRSSRNPGTYSNGSDGCRSFTTGPSGRFVVNYRGVVSQRTADNRFADEFVTITAQLSNGQTLTLVSKGRLV